MKVQLILLASVQMKNIKDQQLSSVKMEPAIIDCVNTVRETIMANRYALPARLTL